jgi:hypothetical protein
MGYIYGAARETIVCLGPAADGSDLLLDCLVKEEIPYALRQWAAFRPEKYFPSGETIGAALRNDRVLSFSISSTSSNDHGILHTTGHALGRIVQATTLLFKDHSKSEEDFETNMLTLIDWVKFFSDGHITAAQAADVLMIDLGNPSQIDKKYSEY